MSEAGLEWNEGFREAVEWAQGTRDPLFITGRAGSGKSTLLRYLKTRVLSNPVVLAPTGVAALAVGGETLHGFFRFPPRVLFSWDSDSFGRPDVLRRVDTLILDEASLVRADVFSAMERVLRRQGPHPGLPFGGARLILFADLHQLPPVVTPYEQAALFSEYEGPWFFQTPAFAKMRWRHVFLEKVYRQQDPLFLERLERARKADPSGEDLEAWNTRLDPGEPDGQSVLTLASTNVLAERRNAFALAALPGPAHCYRARIERDFDPLTAPVPAELYLREEAQVMFLRNHPERTWVNGTLGTVEAMEDDAVFVRIPGRQMPVRVERESWQRVLYEEDPGTGRLRERIAGVYHQMPLKPAWAVTIHKSQGQEFDRIRIDLGRGSFSHGQVYVALSRCRSFEGIRLSRPLKRKDFILDPAVLDFRP